MSEQAIFTRLLNVLTVVPVLALAACDPMTAQPTVPARPVLVTNAHYRIASQRAQFRRNGPAAN